jgi:Domain of unknown function (DUF222)
MGNGPARGAELDISQLDDPALFALLDLVIDRLFDTPTERHGPRIKRLHRARTRVEAVFTAEVGAFDRELEYQIDARRSAAAWISAETKCAKRDAARVIHRARQLAEMPTFAPLFGAGMIDATKTDAACHARKRIDANQRFAEHEPRLARTAVHERTEQLAEQLAQLVDVIETERHDPTSGDGQAWDSTNELHLSALLDGVGVLNARFEPDAHSIIDRAITNAADRARTADDPRPWAQQRGDALAHICNAYLHGQTGGSNRPHLLIHTDLATLNGEAIGLCETDTGRRLPTRALARIACDALISRVLHADSVVLDHGRSVRNFTPAQYRALIAQYPNCVFPGCAVPSCQCDMHHGDWFEHGGPTDFVNGYPCCLTHHNFIHRAGWAVTKRPDGIVSWYRPDGTHYGDTRPRERPRPIPLGDPTPRPRTDEPRPPREWRYEPIEPALIQRCQRARPITPDAHITFGPGPVAHVRHGTRHHLIEFDTS